MKVENHPYVNFYSIYVESTGIYCLTFTCNVNPIVNDFNDYSFLITSTEEEFENWNDSLVIKVPSFLSDEFYYSRIIEVVKNQISVYYIPFNRETVRNRKYLIK